jgi:hypothetical protein
MKTNKLPKPASCATDGELKAYLVQFAETGDRRVLAEEILRLRDMLCEQGVSAGIVTPKPEKPQRKEKDEDIF